MPLGLVIIVLVFLFVYLAVLRPQKRRRLEHVQRLQSVQPGDEVITAGGIYATVTGFEGDDLLVEIAPSLEVRLARRAVAAVVPPPEGEEQDDEEPEEELEQPSGEPAGIPAAGADGSYSDGQR